MSQLQAQGTNIIAKTMLVNMISLSLDLACFQNSSITFSVFMSGMGTGTEIFQPDRNILVTRHWMGQAGF